MPMSALRLQQTVAGPTQVKGFGYWSGQDVCVEFCPAPPDSGITFLRGDREPAVQIPDVVATRANAAGDLSIKYELDYGTTSPIGRQSFELTVSPAAFRRELAASRTFLTDHEARQLKAQGLGGRVTPRDLLVIGAAGPINNPLRFPNECARHKALDVVGDLALAGAPLHADIVAYRSGHELNAELVRRLLAHELQTTCASRCA